MHQWYAHLHPFSTLKRGGVRDRAATHFHYDLAGHLIAETDSNGTPIREYLWLGDTPVGLVATRNAGTQPELFAVHADHLDTALLLTDSTQAVVWRYHREPFGELTAGSNTVRWPLRFPGQYEDQETGIFYNYYRDYDPQTGRYVESDPIGLRGGVNTYAYGGNPISNVDPLGLLVDAYFDSANGRVTVRDRDTGATASGAATSGGHPYGDPLPDGRYEMLDQARNPESFRLDPLDRIPRNDTHDQSGRDRFRLHEPGNTVGCIAVDERSDWDRIRDLIRNTRTDTVMDNARPWWAPWRVPVPITRYGDLYVD